MLSRYEPESEFYTDERCHIIEIHNRPEDDTCSIARARVAPGVTTRLHSLREIAERYVVIEGEGRAEIGGAPVNLRPLDVVTIPPGVKQRITNTGRRDLVFLCICTPRFRQSAYTVVAD